jgi:hypothetical protein
MSLTTCTVVGLDQGALNKIFARNASQCYLF